MNVGIHTGTSILLPYRKCFGASTLRGIPSGFKRPVWLLFSKWQNFGITPLSTLTRFSVCFATITTLNDWQWQGRGDYRGSFVSLLRKYVKTCLCTLICWFLKVPWSAWCQSLSVPVCCVKGSIQPSRTRTQPFVTSPGSCKRQRVASTVSAKQA